MALIPSKTKYRKAQRGRVKGVETRATELCFGSFGLKSLESKWITEKQIEAARKVILRYLKKGGRFWIRIFPDKPVTSKGVEFSMGGGKGDVSHYVAPVRAGRILFEIEGIDEKDAKEAFRKVASKLPVKTKFVKK
jgi:large subunit ribosomal protein L16